MCGIYQARSLRDTSVTNSSRRRRQQTTPVLPKHNLFGRLTSPRPRPKIEFLSKLLHVAKAPPKMPIRDKVRRAIRRSGSSPTTSPTPSTSTSGSSPNSPETKLTSRFAGLSLTRRNRSSSSKSSAAKKPAVDPREKPFSETNLRYQEMFGEYTMRFGASRRLSADWEVEGISPMTSRRNSLCR